VHDELDGNRLTTNELTPFFHCAYDLYIDIAPVKTPKTLHQIKKQCHKHLENAFECYQTCAKLRCTFTNESFW